MADREVIMPLTAVPLADWSALAERCAEPNAFYLPGWARAVDAHATGKTGAQALLAWDGPAGQTLHGFLPVVSAWRALKLPLPMLVAWQAYAPLTAPLIDRDTAQAAASGLIAAAAKAGAQALFLPMIPAAGPAAEAFRRAASPYGGARTLFPHHRAKLFASQVRNAGAPTLSGKRFKELRRQHHRLADQGEVGFEVAATPEDAATALDRFLMLEQSGWKGARRTALACDDGDRRFIGEAVGALTASGQAQIVTLTRGPAPVAAGIVLRHQRRAFFFKTAYDERIARLSPGVHLALGLTRHLCADDSIDDADSIAVADHPMIDRLWDARLEMADLLVPVRRGALAQPLFAAMIASRHHARDGIRRLARLSGFR